MGWFKRLKDGIQTATKYKKEAPDGLWNKCKSCGEVNTSKELKANFYKCTNCDYHFRIGSRRYFEMLYDNGEYSLLFENLRSQDPLKFTDLKPYPERLKSALKNSELTEAISVAHGTIDSYEIVIAAMDFTFIGGSMGSVVGERIAKAIDYVIEHHIPLMIISKSGGARMMEAAFSLMQMAKTSVKLAQLTNAGIPYFSLMTDPTTGGVTASYSMLGDVNFAEPNALIGFAGPRVIMDTIKQDLPEDFQSSEFLLDHGFLDFIINRAQLRDRVSHLLEILQPIEKAS